VVLHIIFHFSGKTDPYVVMILGDQVIKSKKNSQTTVIGLPGEPIWNQVRFQHLNSWMFAEIFLHLCHHAHKHFVSKQDFHLLVGNPRKQKLTIQVKDSIGLTDITIGTGEVEFFFNRKFPLFSSPLILINLSPHKSMLFNVVFPCTPLPESNMHRSMDFHVILGIFYYTGMSSENRIIFLAG
jgi:hypothetical protein